MRLYLQLGAEGCGDILKHQAEGIIQPGSGEQEADEEQKVQLAAASRDTPTRTVVARPTRRKVWAEPDEHAGDQLCMDGRRSWSGAGSQLGR